MASGHSADRAKRRGFRRSAVAASCGACPWPEPSMASGHSADRAKRRGFRRSAVAASCGACPWPEPSLAILFGTGVHVLLTSVGAAHAVSPDAHFGHPDLRSLDAALASPSWLRSASNAARLARAAPPSVLFDHSRC